MLHHHSEKAMYHQDRLGEGAKKRAHIKDPKSKIATVMEEYKHGTLRSGGSGKHVTNPKQAIAIGLSEARKSGAHIPKKHGDKPMHKKKAHTKEMHEHKDGKHHHKHHHLTHKEEVEGGKHSHEHKTAVKAKMAKHHHKGK